MPFFPSANSVFVGLWQIRPPWFNSIAVREVLCLSPWSQKNHFARSETISASIQIQRLSLKNCQMNEREIKCEFVQRQMERFNRERAAIITHDKRLELLSLEAPPG